MISFADNGGNGAGMALGRTRLVEFTRDPTEVLDYAPVDLVRYRQLTESLRRTPDGEVNGPTFMMRWRELEQLRNRYNGNPPRQLCKLKQAA